MKKYLKRLLSILCTLSLAMSMSPHAFAITNNDVPTVTEDVAATIALLFVIEESGNSGDWDDSTNISDVVPLYGEDNTITAYSVELETNGSPSGYIVVTADLNKSLIQEYSTENDPLYKDFSTETTSVNDELKVYFSAPLEYSTEPIVETSQMVAGVSTCTEATGTSSVFEQNAAIVRDLYDLGLVSLNRTARGPITNPKAYLEETYPDAVTLIDSETSISDSEFPSYIISDHNACSLYGISAFLAFHSGNSFSSVKNSVLDVAVDNGYCTSSNYYIEVGDLAPVANDAIDYLGLDLTASSTLFTASRARSEIANERPILLNIGYGSVNDYYNDHTVSAYQWKEYEVLTATSSASFTFFKVRDGWDSGTRYADGGSLTAITYATSFR